MTTGEKSDGKYLQELVKKSQETGMEIATNIGDTAYSEKEKLRFIKENELTLVSKLNLHTTHGTRSSEEEFEFNKDAGMYVCMYVCMYVKSDIWLLKISMKEEKGKLGTLG